MIVVRRDLGAIIHRHPPIRPDGRIVQPIDFPTPGPYRVLIDAYPDVKGAPRNFQLHEDVRVAGRVPAEAAAAVLEDGERRRLPRLALGPEPRCTRSSPRT